MAETGGDECARRGALPIVQGSRIAQETNDLLAVADPPHDARLSHVCPTSLGILVQDDQAQALGLARLLDRPFPLVGPAS
ncbi:hypothetical protein ACIQ6K_35920 [Streptomyces sp. NPDC096354]|uniref:hypothetical protein n=1 Tax=Streptomyces sp. NPDC096354 TaxID=3366088 RepID=UPI00381339CE